MKKWKSHLVISQGEEKLPLSSDELLHSQFLRFVILSFFF